jgi:hypothetical protein
MALPSLDSIAESKNLVEARKPLIGVVRVSGLLVALLPKLLEHI